MDYSALEPLKIGEHLTIVDIQKFLDSKRKAINGISSSRQNQTMCAFIEDYWSVVEILESKGFSVEPKPVTYKEPNRKASNSDWNSRRAK